VEKQNLFPAEEYDARLARVRAAAAERGLDGLLVTSQENIYYLTGYQTFGETQAYLVVPLDGPLILALRELESQLVHLTTYLDSSFRTFTDSQNPLEIVDAALREAGLAGHRVGLELGLVSAKLHEALAAALATVTLVDSAGVVESVRVIKTDREVAACRHAGTMTVRGMKAAYIAAVEGLTENHVAMAAHTAMGEAGAEPLTHDPIVTSGWRSGIAHTSYARRQLAKGDAILLEFSGLYYRYNSPLMRSVVVGEADARTRSMHAACVDALEAAMAVIKPGVTSGEAHDACQQVIDKAGYTDLFRKRLGYSAGLGFKTWSEGSIFDLKAGDPRPIQAGMVLHMPPALRVLGEIGVGCSETIVVTADGCEPLAQLDRALVIS
jgi:Xaa-Pro dipeptidase